MLLSKNFFQIVHLTHALKFISISVYTSLQLNVLSSFEENDSGSWADVNHGFRIKNTKFFDGTLDCRPGKMALLSRNFHHVPRPQGNSYLQISARTNILRYCRIHFRGFSVLIHRRRKMNESTPVHYILIQSPLMICKYFRVSTWRRI